MITTFRNRTSQHNLTTGLIVVAVLASAFLLGRQASPTWLGLLVAGLGGLVLMVQPVLGLLALVVVALVGPLEIGTGTEVKLNIATVLIPALVVIWFLDMLRRRQLYIVSSRLNLPLILFLLAGLLSLLIGRSTWDPVVPVGDNFLLVQLAQWAIFAFSAFAFWLIGNLVADEKWLRRMTALFLLVAGGMAIAHFLPGLGGLVDRIYTTAFERAPFWMLLAALGAGQLFWNRQLSKVWRLFLAVVLLAVSLYAFVEQRETISNWVGLAVVLGTLTWLRFPRLRWPIVVVVVVMAALGFLFPVVYNFAGGDAEWTGSGGSRLVLINRVLDITMRNPITGLGPAAYRLYAAMEPLAYGRAYWTAPEVNSHNNYVDLFSQMGLVGLTLFFWFAAEVTFLSYRLYHRYRSGFRAAYVNGMLAASVGAIVLMLFADWILPFVYNIGFSGFQASVLVWLFLGGLVAIDNLRDAEG